MFVVKIGGSLLFNEDEQINAKLISEYARTIRTVFTKQKEKFVIVVGGGKIARRYITASRVLGGTETQNDILGIEVAKLNARLLIAALGNIACPTIPNSFQEFQTIYALTDKVIVCGGFTPGQSTNAVAAAIAEETNATKLINLTNVDGVFTDDPQKNSQAKLQQSIAISAFKTLLQNQKTSAGNYPLFDLTALQIVLRSKIPLVFANGNNPENLLKAIKGENIGTEIKY
ncbi:MAG: UMP kinase [Candidatus Heimdallarchaeota archaeon]